MKVREVTHSEFVSNMFGVNAQPQRMRMDCVTTSVSIVLGIPYEEVPFYPPVGCYDPDADKVRWFVTQDWLEVFCAEYNIDFTNKFPYSSEVWLAWFEGNGIKMTQTSKRPSGLALAGCDNHCFVSLGNGMMYDVAGGKMITEETAHRIYGKLTYATLKLESKA